MPNETASSRAALAGVAEQQVDLGGAHQLRVDHDVLLPVEPHPREGDLHQLAHRVGLAGGDHVVVGLGLLEHQPHGLDVVAGEAPVALGVEVAEPQLAREPQRDPRHAVGDLAGHELETPRGLSWLNRIPEQAKRS
jgi:hypothetical protein